jgi:tetratricopeptide (TPR) repeat protein
MAEVSWLGKACLVRGVPVRPVIAQEPWGMTAQAWERLPYHPAILEVCALMPAPHVAYADLHAVERPLERVAGSWLADVLSALAHVYRHAEKPGWLTRFALAMDLDHRVRVGFLPAPSAYDPGQPAMAKLVAEVIAATNPPTYSLATLLHSLRQRDYRTLDAACAAIDGASWVRRPRDEQQLRAWRRFERGCGYEECGRLREAAEEYEGALLVDPKLERARTALEWLRTARAEPESSPAVDLATAAEAAGRFAEARDIYARGDTVDDRLGVARCQLALGQLDEAIAIVRVIDVPAAAWIEAAARARKADHAGALDAASRLPDDDPAVWYLRGKALLGLRKHADARAALDRVCALAPGHNAAQILRVEVGRAAARLYRELGRDPPPPAPAGPHADAVARVLAGDVDGAIALLHARDDRDARVMRASCLAFRGRHDDALAAYTTLDGRVAAVGRADCLLGLGRIDDALAAYDAALADDPYDVDALDGRARALDRLGRAGDAEIAHRRATAVAVARDRT